MNSNVKLRSAQIDDLSRIVKIQNDIIIEGGLTADVNPYLTEEKMSWYEETITKPYCLRVLEVNDVVAGYVYLSPWRKGRGALKHVAEVSYFLAKQYRGAGYGRMLLKEGVSHARQNGFNALLAILLDTNMPSIRLLKSEGFLVAGHLPEVAEIQDGISGQLIMLKKTTPGLSQP